MDRNEIDRVSVGGENTPLVCDLTAIDPDQREAHERSAERVLGSVTGISETAGGYSLRLPADPETAADAGRFIALERLCCPFFTFDLRFEPNGGSVRLELSGGAQVKEYIKENVLPTVREAQRR